MTVYVVVDDYHYESSVVEGVFSTPEKAIASIPKWITKEGSGYKLKNLKDRIEFESSSHSMTILFRQIDKDESN